MQFAGRNRLLDEVDVFRRSASPKFTVLPLRTGGAPGPRRRRANAVASMHRAVRRRQVARAALAAQFRAVAL